MSTSRGRRGGGRATISDVAKLAGVGAITVSRAMREPERVSPALRMRIEEAIAQLNYAPNPAARALASARGQTVGVLVPSLTNNVFSEVIRGLYDEIAATPYQVQIGNMHYSAQEEERLVDAFLRQQPAALIVSGIDQTSAARKKLQAADCPVVQIMEVGSEPIDMLVGFSHFDGGHAAADHLIAAGYRRLAFLCARMDPRSQRRMAGYRMRAENAGVFDPARVLTTSELSSVSLGRTMAARLLDTVPDADALFCNNDDLALGVLFEAQARGLRVPEDLGIVGFNDLEMMQAAVPAVTSIRTPRYEIGRKATSMVLQRLAEKPVETPVLDLGFELIPRQSTARFS